MIPSILEPDGSFKEYRRNWARLIQKLYEIDPLCCPKCSGKMRILGFIEDEQVIEKILKHLGLWDVKAKPPPKANAPPLDIHTEYSDSQRPLCEDDLYYDPDYPKKFYKNCAPCKRIQAKEFRLLNAERGIIMKIGGFDTDEKVFVIAEIGNNHEGSYAYAEEMIGLAAGAGADAVKFQTFRAEYYVSPKDRRWLPTI